MLDVEALMEVRFSQIDWEFKVPFRIAYRTRTHARTVLVELQQAGLTGRGEALGVSYHNETIETLLAQLESVANRVRAGVSRTELQQLLPPGGARNALDCALWDLEAKHAGKRVWDLLNIGKVRPLATTYTLGADTAEVMARKAAEASSYSRLKLKLLGEGDYERVARVRDARPDAQLFVDANQAWDERQLHELTPRLAALGVQLIEQPLPAGKDDALTRFASPVPLCADESCQTAESLPNLIGKYQYVNIKLDKTGGLTEALRLARLASAAGMKLMVGCMGGSSLSMAPAFVAGQLCELVDLDSPLLIKADVSHGLNYTDDVLLPPEAELWG